MSNSLMTLNEIKKIYINKEIIQVIQLPKDVIILDSKKISDSEFIKLANQYSTVLFIIIKKFEINKYDKKYNGYYDWVDFEEFNEKTISLTMACTIDGQLVKVHYQDDALLNKYNNMCLENEKRKINNR